MFLEMIPNIRKPANPILVHRHLVLPRSSSCLLGTGYPQHGMAKGASYFLPPNSHNTTAKEGTQWTNVSIIHETEGHSRTASSRLA